MINQFFDTVKLLNLDKRRDRLEAFTNHALSINLQFERFKALPHIGPHQSFNFSFLAILAEFWHSGKETLLFIEDDCQFQNLDKLPAAINQLPANWDMLYLGANLLDHEGYSKNLVRVKKAWATHAVAFRREVVWHILTNYHNVSAQMFDNWLGEEIHPKFNCFMCKPVMAVQRPGYSDIWQKEVDYTELFKSVNRKVK